jgi:porin
MSLLSIGWAWPAGADEPPSDTPVEATAAPEAHDDSEPTEAWSAGDYLTLDYLEEVWQRDRLTGDWGGLRTDLGDRGIKPQVKFTQFGQGVASGGIDTDAEYGGKVDWILDVDVSKFLGLWPGLFINLHAETQYGKSILANAGPSVLPNTPMLLPLPKCDCTEMTNLTLMQGLWEGTIPLQDDKGAVVFAAGKLNIVDLLTTSFPNFGYGLEGFLNWNALYPA